MRVQASLTPKLIRVKSWKTKTNRQLGTHSRRPRPPPAQPTLKPIVFDMETVSGHYQFDNADDLSEFIQKLEKIKGLMPSKH